MLTHDQLACIQKYVEIQTLRYIQRLFSDIEDYLKAQQIQMNPHEHSLDSPPCENQRQFIQAVFENSSMNKQSNQRNFPSCNNIEQSNQRDFPICHHNRESSPPDFSLNHAQINARTQNIPSVPENDMLNTAIAALPARYSNGHRVPQYYLARLKLTLQLIYSRPGIVRKDLAASLQVSERTVSNLCGFLLKHHLIVIKDYREGRWYPPVSGIVQ